MTDERIPSIPPSGPDPARRTEQWVLFTLVALALAVRLYRIDWGLPLVLEEAVPLKKAWDMWGFGPMRAFDPNPHWFQYPSLIIYVQLLGEAFTSLVLRLTGIARSGNELNLLYLSDPTAFYRVGRGITALFGAATVFPVWAIARRAGGLWAAIVAALLVALHPGLVAKSQVVEVDVPLVFFVMLGLARALALGASSSRREWFVSGLVAGLATSAKYPGLILLLPFAYVAWGATGPRAPRVARVPAAAAAAPASRRDRERKARTRVRPDATPGAPSPFGAWLVRMATFGGGLALALVATSPFLFLDPHEAARDLAIGRQLMTLGHFGVSAGTAYATYARDWFTTFLGAPLGLLGLAGLAWFAVRRERWAIALVALALPFSLVVGSWQMKADRYLLPLAPIAAIAAGVLLARLGQLWAPRLRPAATLVPALGGLACALPLLLMLPPYWRTLDTDTRDQSRRWIESHLPPGSFVASELYGPELLSPMQLLTADGDVLAQIKRRSPSRPLYALQTVPMFVMDPGRSAKYYDLAHYEQADVFVVTSGIRGRYLGDSLRYAPQLAFYASLEARWPRIAHFEPHGGPGPVIDVYRNPAVTKPFAARGDDPLADPAVATAQPVTGAEAYWYMNLGLDMELAGHDRGAEQAYLLALRFGATEPANYARVAIRLAGLKDAQGRKGEALQVLRSCAAQAPSQSVAVALASTEQALRAGKPICVRVRP